MSGSTEEVPNPKPELKQFGELRQHDFDRHPAWVNCHTIDYSEPWYDETDEETFRPWEFPLPSDPDGDMYLVKASATLANGLELPGFMTPDRWEWEDASTAEKMGFLQPGLFVPSGEMVEFWEGWRGTDGETIEQVRSDRDVLYQAISRDPSEIFPILFETEPDVTTFPTSISVEGFYFISMLGTYEYPNEELGCER